MVNSPILTAVLLKITGVLFIMASLNECMPMPLLKLDIEESRPFAVILSIASATSIIFNIAIIVLFVKIRNLRTTSNKLLISLAVSDLCVGAIISPLSIAQLVKGKTHPECSTLHILSIYTLPFLAVTELIICTIALDRYLKITKVAKYHSIMKGYRLNLLILGPWLFPILLILIGSRNKAAANIVVSILFLVGYTCIFLSYRKIYCYIKLRQHNFGSSLSISHIESMLKQNKKVIALIWAVSISALSCGTPSFIYRWVLLVEHYKVGDMVWVQQRIHLFGATATTMLQLNSAINPLLYFWLSQEFRKAIKQLILPYLIKDIGLPKSDNPNKRTMNITPSTSLDLIANTNVHSKSRTPSISPFTKYRVNSNTIVESRSAIGLHSEAKVEKYLQRFPVNRQSILQNASFNCNDKVTITTSETFHKLPLKDKYKVTPRGMPHRVSNGSHLEKQHNKQKSNGNIPQSKYVSCDYRMYESCL